MANYAIGDIQGCYKEFRLALKKVNFDIENDYLWLVGDLINRGPDSLKLIKYLYKIRKRAHIVLGNHELHFLSCLYGLRELSKTDTLSKTYHNEKISKICRIFDSTTFNFSKKNRISK
jgi:bis(5'-nucleosyl)-tetraphosphatase (symmetrical)